MAYRNKNPPYVAWSSHLVPCKSAGQRLCLLAVSTLALVDSFWTLSSWLFFNLTVTEHSVKILPENYSSPSQPSLLLFFFKKTKQNYPNFDLGAWEILICTLLKMMVGKSDFPVLAIPCHHEHGMPIPQYLREVCRGMNWRTLAFSHSHTTEFT